MRVTAVWPRPGGLNLEENLFIGRLNTSQVLSKSPVKLARSLVSWAAYLEYTNKTCTAELTGKKQNLHEERREDILIWSREIGIRKCGFRVKICWFSLSAGRWLQWWCRWRSWSTGRIQSPWKRRKAGLNLIYTHLIYTDFSESSLCLYLFNILPAELFCVLAVLASCL